MVWRRLPLVIVFVPCGFSSAHSQRSIEVTPFGGSRFGGVIQVNGPAADKINIKNSADYGVLADVSIWPELQAE